MPLLHNHRLIQALFRQPVDKTPIWLMRQAGRYLPEYRELRAKAGSFLNLCKTPELACEITLQPLRRFPLDAAILFSDILTIPDAMGLGLQLIEGRGPVFERPIKHPSDIQKLRIPDPSVDLPYVDQAIRLVRKELNNTVPLIGFCGSPWTLACYMIQGESEPGFPKLMALKNENPNALHQLLEKLTQAITDLLNAQIDSGAQIIMIFDTWGGLLSHDTYPRFSLQYMGKILSNLQLDKPEQPVPTILFTKGGGEWLESIANTGCHGISLDSTIDIQDARQRVGHKVALQGNLDQDILFKTKEDIEQQAKKILEAYGPNPGHIFNLGHGVKPNTPVENVECLVDFVHGFFV